MDVNWRLRQLIDALQPPVRLLPPYIRAGVPVAVALPEIGKRYHKMLQPDELRLGHELYIAVNAARDAQFSKHAVGPFQKYWVTRIQWEAGLPGYPGQQLHVYARRHMPAGANDDVIDSLHAPVKTLISRKEVEQAVRHHTAQEKVAHLGMKQERRKSLVHGLETVAARLVLCESLAARAGADVVGTQQLGLVVYLLLTCFDRLGQVGRFVQFDDFLLGKKAKYRERRVQALSEAGPEPVEQALALYRAYQRDFSVTNSFHRFIDKVLPEAERQRLMSSVHVFETGFLDRGKRREVDEQGVKDFLFRFRNRYTHQADVQPGLTIPPPPESMAGIPPAGMVLSFYDQWHEEDRMVTVMFHDLPDTLFQCVRAGLVARLRGGLE